MHHYSKGIEAFGKERSKQIEQGYTIEHDSMYHDPEELIGAALCYADFAKDQLDHLKGYNLIDPPLSWPWYRSDWKPSDSIQCNLEKAGALLAAAYDLSIRGEKGNDSTTNNV